MGNIKTAAISAENPPRLYDIHPFRCDYFNLPIVNFRDRLLQLKIVPCYDHYRKISHLSRTGFVHFYILNACLMCVTPDAWTLLFIYEHSVLVE